ncbi:thiaminase II [Staphylococcus condimenti]|uniref:Aminopyrimidine aminohydrolase n=1 Tax=Staphylococcus condimenti TaxID=70255 RepID=A0A143PEB5_9STAP|nr:MULTISPECIES: thiaminase II [Staphylococcus]AMY06650.1 thiaminase II [Staphylococcus condimenti]APR60531.1 thiaminase II [Staphylococcus condimenti]MDK8645834.1 thiaminase II [Staphylococcus condimenti]OFP03509.1 thiaminase II [Staphylococcus sp. HMSC065E08]PNZ61560.1 thiaminase II [Staphylococcus condimenti]
MNFAETLERDAQPIIDEIYQDHFIQELLKGDIEKEALRQYLRADASYLREFANIYALLIPKMPDLESVRFLVDQIQFIVNGEVEAHEYMADYIGENYNEIVQKKVWPPSGDHYIKHMYYNVYAHENAAYAIAAMAPCPYVYAIIAKRAMKDPNLNKSSILAKWFEFYNTEMDPLIEVLDDLMNQLTANMSETEKNEVRENYLQSTVHELNFFNMAYTSEKWQFGGERV